MESSRPSLPALCLVTSMPDAAQAALEQLAKCNHKRPQHMYLVIVPHLLMSLWRNLLNKICDLTFTIPVGSDLWDSPQFEPLLVGLYLLLSRHKPWKLRGTPLLDREPTSLDKNLLVCQQGMMVGSALGFKSKLFRPMEPYPLEDNVGMGATIVMLQLSLNPGKNSDHVQFATVQKFRSIFP